MPLRFVSGLLILLGLPTSPVVARAQPEVPKFAQKLPQPNWVPATLAKPASPADTKKAAPLPTLDDVIKAADIFSAMTLARVRTHEDVKGWLNVAGILVFGWSLAHLKWVDIYAPVNETSWVRVAKNPSGEFGKRLCVEGVIRSMATRTERGSTYYHGLIYPTLSLDGYYFLALGNSGTYVQGSTARFCGVAVGLTEGLNGFGMPMNAVAITGFFDLAINQI